MSSILITDARLVPVGTGRASVCAEPQFDQPLSLRIRDGVVTEVAAALKPIAQEQVYDAEGRWAIPGLWDHHVHMGQWAIGLNRLDLAGTASPAEVVERVTNHLRSNPQLEPGVTIQGLGFRSATWAQQPTVRELDAVTGDRPTILISGDLHNGWLNTAALRALEIPDRDSALSEAEWFAAYSRLNELPGVAGPTEAAYAEAVRQASSRGVVGIVDLELAANYADWPTRFAAGIDGLRVRAATYPDHLDGVIEAGLRSGDVLDGDELLTMGPLKVISDGSLNTGTAFCCDPYSEAGSAAPTRGLRNLTQRDLEELCRRATDAGLEMAIHAIGDAALKLAMDAFEVSDTRGSIEHAQLITTGGLRRMAKLGIRASVQPAHLLDDRDATMRIWPDRADRCFAFRSMLDAGVELRLGSDAPVAPLDPWLAMAAAVHRSADDREPWHPEQALTAAEALAASTDGQGTLAVGSRGDLVLLSADPLAAGPSAQVAAHLREMHVAATFVSGRATYWG
jgi:predicted amidohydrolase YtcJ